VLLLTHDEVAQLVTLDEAVKVMEIAYEELGTGDGVERPRTHTYTSLKEPDLRYLFKSMDGIVPSLGVAALRITSEMNPFKREAGVLRTFKIPLRQQEVKGDYWLGLIFLFNIQSGELMAILPDGLIGKIRMAASTTIAAKRLARKEASTVGILGSSWQAEGQIEGLACALSLKKVEVYSPNSEHRKGFAQRMSQRFSIDIIPVNDPVSAINGKDLAVAATNAYEPVMRGEWLEEGVHLTSILHREVDETCFTRPDIVILNHKMEMMDYFPGRKTYLHWEKGMERWPDLGELAAGKVNGRAHDKQITHFMNNGGLAGVQFAAVALQVVQRAREVGLGRELPLDWFLQPVHN